MIIKTQNTKYSNTTEHIHTKTYALTYSRVTFEKKKLLLKWSFLFAQGAIWNCPRTHSGPLLLQKKVKFEDILPEINIRRP